MAIYHLNLKSGSRASGQSAAAKLDYIEREGKYEKGKAEITYIEHGNLPEFVLNNPREYWASADTFERANGRLFTQIEFALPKELNTEQQIALARRFVQSVCRDKYQLPYSFAIHKGQYDHSGKHTNQEAKPHVHLIFSERENDGITRTAEQWFKRANKHHPEKGGAAKVRVIKSTEWLKTQRKTWAKLANEALEKAGHEVRIDHRTLEAQGITDRLPQIKKGKSAHMEKRGITDERMKAFKARLLTNEILANLQQENREIVEKIEIAKTEILRLAREVLFPEHQNNHPRSIDSLNSFEQVRSLETLPSINTFTQTTKNRQIALSDIPLKTDYAQRHTLKALGAKWDKDKQYWYIPKGENLEAFTDYLPQQKDKDEHDKHAQHDMRPLLKQRHDTGNHHQPKRTENRRENLLYDHARDDMEAYRRASYPTMQPIRSQHPQHRRGLSPEQAQHAQAIAALTAQYSYQQLMMYVDNKTRAYIEAEKLYQYTKTTLEQLTPKLKQHSQNIRRYQAEIDELQQGFMGKIRHKKDIAKREASIKQENLALKKVKETLQQQRAQLEPRKNTLERAKRELEQYALALQASGIDYRKKHLQEQPNALKEQWRLLEQKIERQHIAPERVLTHERHILAEFQRFTQQQKQPETNRQFNKKTIEGR